MRDATERVRKYELMVIFSPDVAEEELPAAIDKVSGFVSTSGGTVTTVLRDSPWGRRRLAYPIRFTGRDIRDGYYVLYYFDADSLTIVEIERELKLFDRVMRHMLIIQVAPLIVPEAPAEAPQAPVPTPAADSGSEPAAPVETAVAPAEAEPASTIEPEAEPASPIDDAANVAPLVEPAAVPPVEEPAAEPAVDAPSTESASEPVITEPAASADSPVETPAAELLEAAEASPDPSTGKDDTPAA